MSSGGPSSPAASHPGLRRALTATAAATLAGLAAAAALAAPAAQTEISSNWSGYAVTGVGSTATTAAASTSFTDVTGTWVQPAAACTPGQSTSAAIWVGLGGYTDGSSTLEQTGTSADCDATGKATYYIWYELVPAASVTVKLKIAPGDTITASVLITNPTTVLVQVKNRTRHTSFTKRLTMAQPDVSSAEWIAEAPSECTVSGFCRTVPLTNFGSVSFSNVAALGNGQGGTLVGPGWQTVPIQLVPRARRFFGDVEASARSTAGASPANLAPDGRSFTVNWLADATAGAPASAPAATTG